jgi:energy-coupling factor transporter ATP-binding protein EcfA2
MAARPAPTEPIPERVVVIGCAGSGKTTLARALAARLGARHLERDARAGPRAPAAVHLAAPGGCVAGQPEPVASSTGNATSERKRGTLASRSVQQSNHCVREEFLYELKAGPAGGRLRRPSSRRQRPGRR